MARINVQRFRDVLVEAEVAEEAPALSVSVALDEEFESFANDLATKHDLLLLTAEIKAEITQQSVELRAEDDRRTIDLKTEMAEQSARYDIRFEQLATELRHQSDRIDQLTIEMARQSAEIKTLAANMQQQMAEQEARHQQHLNRLTATVLAGGSLIAAVTGVLVAVFG